jgi:hypothetical protein
MKSENEAGALSDLAGLQVLITSARGLVNDLMHDPLFQRLIAAFFTFPEADRETILGVLERDASWCHIVSETASTTGITVKPNPHASLYVHVLEEATPSPRDVDVIRHGIERFIPLLPLFFQDGVREQWMRSARELIEAADPEVRALGVRLARDVLALLGESS